MKALDIKPNIREALLDSDLAKADNNDEEFSEQLRRAEQLDAIVDSVRKVES